MGDNNIKEAIETFRAAVNAEEKGYKFFKELSEKLENFHGRDMFAFLADEEKKHKAILLGQIEKLINGKIPEKIEQISSAAALKEKIGEFFIEMKKKVSKGIMPDADSIKAIKEALEIEKGLYNIYKEYLSKTDNAIVIDVYGFLMTEEKRHYRILDDTLEYLETPLFWFQREEKHMFDGG